MSTNRSEKAFTRGLQGGIFTAAMPELVKSASNDHGCSKIVMG
jgi:hypothetical protein